MHIVDINECKREIPPCDENATCANTIGSYTCTCNDGFTGEGSNGTCEGMYVLSHVLQLERHYHNYTVYPSMHPGIYIYSILDR